MNDKQYNTSWVQKGEMPLIDTECPKCGQGLLEKSKWEGVWCRSCKWKWKISKFPPDKMIQKVKAINEERLETIEEENQGERILKNQEEIIERLDRTERRIIKLNGK